MVTVPVTDWPGDNGVVIELGVMVTTAGGTRLIPVTTAFVTLVRVAV
jgi:hypothetical protein